MDRARSVELMAEIADAGALPTPTMRRLWGTDPFLRNLAQLLFGATSVASGAGTVDASVAKTVLERHRTELVARKARRSPTIERGAAGEA